MRPAPVFFSIVISAIALSGFADIEMQKQPDPFEKVDTHPHLSAETVQNREEEVEKKEEGSPPVIKKRQTKTVCYRRHRNGWYLDAKPGYYYLTSHRMRQFFETGGFTARLETGYKFSKPVAIWLDAGYFQKSGHALGGGGQDLHLRLASITLGVKGLFYWRDVVGFYAGVGPRLFMMLLHNHTVNVRSEDNQIGIGAGFDAGFWFLPLPWVRNLFIDVFADYSLKTMDIDEDANSSLNFDVDVSGVTMGVGLGYRF